RHVSEVQFGNRRDRYRYRQKLFSRCGSGSTWRDRAAPEVVMRPSGNTARQPDAVSDRHGGLHRRTPSEPQTHIARSRRQADAGKVGAPFFEGEEERLPRCGGNRGGGAAPDDEVRRDEDRRAARLTSRSTGCGSGWSVSALGSSTRSAPSCWSAALPFGK